MKTSQANSVFMNNLKSTITLILVICFSCKNSNLESGDSMDDTGNTTIGIDSSKSNETPPEEQYTPPSPSNEIEMEDGMTDENGDIVDPNSINQSSSSSSIYNAYQCSSCAFISMGTTEPAASAFNNCIMINYSRLHFWNKINTNGHGKQCSNCGIKYYVGNSVVEYSFDGCANSNNGHYWVEF
jgi:hypothetical protein